MGPRRFGALEPPHNEQPTSNDSPESVSGTVGVIQVRFMGLHPLDRALPAASP